MTCSPSWARSRVFGVSRLLVSRLLVSKLLVSFSSQSRSWTQQRSDKRWVAWSHWEAHARTSQRTLQSHQYQSAWGFRCSFADKILIGPRAAEHGIYAYAVLFIFAHFDPTRPEVQLSYVATLWGTSRSPDCSGRSYCMSRLDKGQHSRRAIDNRPAYRQSCSLRRWVDAKFWRAVENFESRWWISHAGELVRDTRSRRTRINIARGLWEPGWPFQNEALGSESFKRPLLVAIAYASHVFKMLPLHVLRPTPICTYRSGLRIFVRMARMVLLYAAIVGACRPRFQQHLARNATHVESKLGEVVVASFRNRIYSDAKSAVLAKHNDSYGSSHIGRGRATKPSWAAQDH